MAKNGKSKGQSRRDEAPDKAAGAASNGKSGDEAAIARAAKEAEAEKEAGAAEAAAAERGEEAAAKEPPASGSAEALASSGEPQKPAGAAWAAPIVRFDARWTWFEQRLITFVLLWQIFALVAWVFLNGLSESVTQSAGVVFRAVMFAIIAGTAAWVGAKKQPEQRRVVATLSAVAGALIIAPLWRAQVIAAQTPETANGLAVKLQRLDVSLVNYFDNIKGWLQEGSTLTLLGGLRGLGTRLTLWLALLGGSLATGAGKHIHIDVIFRFLPKKARIPAAIFNYLVAATVCFAAVWGFFDHIAIESYGAKADDRAGAKIATATHKIGHHMFFTRKQIGLDLRSLPHVLGGERYDQWMTAARWNEWLDGAGFEDRFDPAKVKALRLSDMSQTHSPLVVSPDGENTRGSLAHTLGLVFPFGLFAIALRFLLRALLTLSGHLSADPDEAHKEDLGHRDEEKPAAEGGV